MAELHVAERRTVRRGFDMVTLTGGEARDRYELEVPTLATRDAPSAGGVVTRRAPASLTVTRDATGDGNDDAPLLFRGHAAVFDEPATIGWFVERIARGAMRKAIRRSPDCRALLNHDVNYVLASVRNGTLKLEEDAQGLLSEFDAAPTTYARDTHLLVERGDLDQMSFWFTIVEDRWIDHQDGTVERIIEEVGELFDVSIVTFPAYAATDVTIGRTLSDSPEPTQQLVASRDTGGADDEDHDVRKARLTGLQARAQRDVTANTALRDRYGLDAR